MRDPLKILIVEDEFVTMNAIEEALIDAGYEIFGTAKSADEALNLLKSKSPDLAILDINIHGEKDGIWLAEQISSKYNIPFIFLTAYGDKRTVEQAMKAEPFGYLVKPFNQIDVYTAIEVAIKNFEKISTRQTSITLKSNIQKSPVSFNDILFVKESHFYSRLKVEEINYVKAQSRGVIAYTKQKDYQLGYSFTELSQVLPSDKFVQTHRSYLVNIHSVDHIGGNFLKIGVSEIPISSQRRNEVLSAFKIL